MRSILLLLVLLPSQLWAAALDFHLGGLTGAYSYLQTATLKDGTKLTLNYLSASKSTEISRVASRIEKFSSLERLDLSAVSNEFPSVYDNVYIRKIEAGGFMLNLETPESSVMTRISDGSEVFTLPLDSKNVSPSLLGSLHHLFQIAGLNVTVPEYIDGQTKLLKALLVEQLSENASSSEPDSRKKDTILLEIIQNLSKLEKKSTKLARRLRSRLYFRKSSKEKTSRVQMETLNSFSTILGDMMSYAPALGLDAERIRSALDRSSPEDRGLLLGSGDTGTLLMKKFGESLENAISGDAYELALDRIVKYELSTKPVEILVPIAAGRKTGLAAFTLVVKASHEDKELFTHEQRITFNTSGVEDLTSGQNFENWKDEAIEAIEAATTKTMAALPEPVQKKFLDGQAASKRTQKLLASGQDLEAKAKMLVCQGRALKK